MSSTENHDAFARVKQRFYLGLMTAASRLVKCTHSYYTKGELDTQARTTPDKSQPLAPTLSVRSKEEGRGISTYPFLLVLSDVAFL